MESHVEGKGSIRGLFIFANHDSEHKQENGWDRKKRVARRVKIEFPLKNVFVKPVIDLRCSYRSIKENGAPNTKSDDKAFKMSKLSIIQKLGFPPALFETGYAQKNREDLRLPSQPHWIRWRSWFLLSESLMDGILGYVKKKSLSALLFYWKWVAVTLFCQSVIENTSMCHCCYGQPLMKAKIQCSTETIVYILESIVVVLSARHTINETRRYG